MKAKRTHIKRSARKNRGITKKILTTFAFGGTLLFASSELAKTPDKPADKDKPTLVVETQKTSISNTVESKLIAQADRYPTVAGNTPLPPELAELDKVSLSEIRKLDRDSEKYRFGGAVTEDGYYPGVVAYFRGLKFAVFANINYHSNPEVGGTINGKGIALEEITELAKLYKLATGKDLKYVKLVVEKGENEYGPYIGIYVVPVDSPKGEIKINIPTWGFTYYLNEGKTYSGRNLIK